MRYNIQFLSCLGNRWAVCFLKDYKSGNLAHSFEEKTGKKSGKSKRLQRINSYGQFTSKFFFRRNVFIGINVNIILRYGLGCRDDRCSSCLRWCHCIYRAVPLFGKRNFLRALAYFFFFSFLRKKIYCNEKNNWYFFSQSNFDHRYLQYTDEAASIRISLAGLVSDFYVKFL